MENKDLLKIDNILWDIRIREVGELTPLCPIHYLRLKLYPAEYSIWDSNILTCEECEEQYILSRTVAEEQRYIIDKLDSRNFKKMKVLNLDDEAIPIAEARASSKDEKYFVTAILTESKVGQRLVVYAGEKGKKEKTQIFVEPDIKRIAFDQKDLHPSDVFVKLEGTFEDGVRFTVDKDGNGGLK